MFIELSRENYLELTGQHLGYSSEMTIDQPRITAFADVTGDHQWIHVDPVAAATSPWGRTIAHGYLLVSLVPVLLREVVHIVDGTPVINVAVNSVSFRRPVPVNSQLRAGVRLSDAAPWRDSLRATFDVDLFIREHQRPVVTSQVVLQW